MAQIPFVTTPHDSGLGNPLATAFEYQQSMNTELYDTVVFEVPGMGLSEVSFTAADKAKLDAIVLPVAPQVQSDYGQTNPLAIDFIKNKKENLSEFNNDGDGVNPFVADVDVAGQYVRVDGAWVSLDDVILPKIQITATAGQTVFLLGTTALVKAVFREGAILDDSEWSQTGSSITTTFGFELGERFKPI